MCGGGFEVGHRQEGIRRRLEPDEVGALRRRPGLVELDELQAPALELLERDRGPEVGAFGERDRLTGRQERQDDAEGRGGSRREEQRLAAFELTERTLGRKPVRVGVALVVQLAGLGVPVGQMVARSSGSTARTLVRLRFRFDAVRFLT